MKKIISALVILSASSSAFALSPAAIGEALKVSKITNIAAITQDEEALQPRCMCELVKIVGVDANGNQVSQTVTVEHRGNNEVKVVGQ
jgi:hypothetical protein